QDGDGANARVQRRGDFQRFFFSSRRRHTRWPRDWSSDVCSSDLIARPLILLSSSGTILIHAARQCDFAYLACFRNWASLSRYLRSEERRVGKECISRWSPDQSK